MGPPEGYFPQSSSASRFTRGACDSKLEPSMFSAIHLVEMGSKRLASARWSEIHPDRLTSNKIEAQSELNRIKMGSG